MHFLCLPVELVSKILTGMEIADLLNVSRTALYLRAVCLTDRQIWRLALDAEMLPLPAGRTLDSIEMPLVLCCASRAIAISATFQRPTINPLRCVELTSLYNLEAWKMCLEKHPSRCHILPGAPSFLLGGGSWLGLYDIRGNYAHEFNYHGLTPEAFAWESHDNGGSIILGVVWSEKNGSQR
ncbi:hypothetical protein B0H11DRAFT_1923638 [Mycena galericulata]|nr:hypothetical protein B0H11DRAFT_1923638 [Mycena galericulata]